MVERLVFGRSGSETLDLEHPHSDLEQTLNNTYAMPRKYVAQDLVFRLFHSHGTIQSS